MIEEGIMMRLKIIIPIIALVALSAFLVGCTERAHHDRLPPGETFPSLMDKAEQYEMDNKLDLALQELDKVHEAYSGHWDAHMMKSRITAGIGGAG